MHIYLYLHAYKLIVTYICTAVLQEFLYQTRKHYLETGRDHAKF